MNIGLSNAKLGLKLPLVIGVLVSVTILALSIANGFKTAGIIDRNARAQLESNASLKRDSINALLNSIDRDIRLQAAAPATSQALIALADGYASLNDAEAVLQRVFITENEEGMRDALVSADTGSSYGFIHAIYHPTLDNLQNEMQYYDVLLFDTQGNLVYSVKKNQDFATNVLDGPFAQTNMSRVYRQAMALGAADPSTFVDFEVYEPQGFIPAAFIARPIFNEQGTRLGVLAYQMPNDLLNQTGTSKKGLGPSADSFLVGSDRVMRTDSPQTEQNDMLAKVVDHPAISEALTGESRIFQEEGHAGQPVMGFAVPLSFLGTEWVVVVQKDKAELYSGLWSVLQLAALISGAVLTLALTCAVLFSRSISMPLQRLTQAVTAVAEGQIDADVPGTDRADEIGELARKTEVFRKNALKIDAMVKDQKAANEKMAALTEEREKAAERELTLAREKERADQVAEEQRQDMMQRLGSSFGEVVESALDGEFKQRIDMVFEDEILSNLANNMNALLEAVDHGLSTTGNVLERVAEGDLTCRMEGAFKGAFDRLQSDVNNMLDALTQLIVEITDSGTTLSGSSSELRQTADVLSRQAEQNAASVEETSAALEQLTASIAQVNANIADVSSSAKEARKTASESDHVAVSAQQSMDRIAQGSKEITRVTEVINDISFQINLLALNAGVEAARAGDAGRGFSVVASEVRQLAQRASEAAKEIGEVLAKSDAAVSDGVSNVANAKTSLDEISSTVVRISENVDDVTRAMSEQASGIKEIASAVAQVDGNTQKQAAAFEEVTASSHVLASNAETLRQSTSRFKIKRPTQTATTDLPAQVVTKNEMPAKAAGAEDFDNWDEF
ncbi:MAG: methyl-accepting chemotaxis protein [Pseudomonadota bacterium]